MWSTKRIAAVTVAGVAAVGLTGATVAAVAADDTRVESRLDALVEDGSISRDEADAAERALDALGQQLQDEMAERDQERQQHLDAIAQAAGVSTDDLVERWQAGESLAEIAGDNAAAVESVLTQTMQERLDEMQAAIPERVASLMEQSGPGMGHEFGAGRGHGHGMSGDGDLGWGPGMGLGDGARGPSA
jgi:polyhydroxyalkanoate synthesis regulator phasin